MSQRLPPQFSQIRTWSFDGLSETYDKAQILRELGIKQDIIDGLKDSERDLGLMPLLDLCKKKQSKLGKVLYR